MTKKIQRAKRAEERGREEFGELSDWGGVSFALSLFAGYMYNPPPPPPPQLFHHPHSAHVYGRHATFPPENPKRTIPCPPRSEAFSCFCLSRNLSFPVAISWTTYSDTFADQTLRSCRNFHNFFFPNCWGERLLNGEGVGKNSACIAWIGCARAVWKWIL